MTRYGAADWDRAVEALLAADEVAIACHVNPDGDAIGSLLGAAFGLAQLGKKTFAGWGVTPAEVPEPYKFLPGADAVLSPADIPHVGTLLALDCGAADRLGELEDRIASSDVVVNVDHHAGNDSFGTFNIVVSTASSTAELVARLLQDGGVELDRTIATCLYTGLMTDTGRFTYSSATPDALRLGAELLALGVAADDIALHVYESVPFGYLKLLGRMLERASLCHKERLVFSYITRQDLDDTGVGIDETENLIGVLRSTRSADVAALFKEQADGTYRVSLRSKGPNVGAIARARGGGGHDLAAGFSATDVPATVRALRRELS